MESRVFLDANIVLDLLSQQRPNHSQAKMLILMLIEQNIQICISEDILTTVYYIAKDKQQVIVFFQTMQKRWLILPFGHDMITQALEYALEKNADLEDTLQCLCAKKNGCTMLVTNDKKFVDCGVEIVNYERFFKLD
jgi:predicted nucleic acid-binding protein